MSDLVPPEQPTGEVTPLRPKPESRNSPAVTAWLFDEHSRSPRLEAHAGGPEGGRGAVNPTSLLKAGVPYLKHVLIETLRLAFI
jgi:hypothetical protein